MASRSSLPSASLGVRLAIDDFGIGYSSLSYLRKFDVDLLKIDRSFVNEVAKLAREASFVAAIVEMGHVLGLKTVAEGVETAEQLARLRELGCDLAQGYLFARPLSAAAARTFLEDGARTHTPEGLLVPAA